MSFVHHSRELGFTLKECAELLGLYKNQERKNADVKALTQQKIADVENKITQLKAIRKSLQEQTNGCQGDDQPD